MTLLTFEVADRHLALPAHQTQEVLRAVAISPLPKAPPIVEGVINLRGTIVPVLDLRQRFGLPPDPLTPEQHFLVTVADARLVALRVARAVDVVEVPEGVIEAAERVVPGAEHVAGIARLPDGLLVIQDLERFLSAEEGERVDASLSGYAGRSRARKGGP